MQPLLKTPRVVSGALLWLALCGLPLPAQALSLSTCTVLTQSVLFGSYNPIINTPQDSTGQVTVTCTLLIGLSLLTTYDVYLGSGGAASYAPRGMSFLGNRLGYNLYTDSSYGTVWGDGSGGTGHRGDSYTLQLVPVLRNYTVYGRIPARQAIPAGSYSDVVTVSVVY